MELKEFKKMRVKLEWIPGEKREKRKEVREREREGVGGEKIKGIIMTVTPLDQEVFITFLVVGFIFQLLHLTD